MLAVFAPIFGSSTSLSNATKMQTKTRRRSMTDRPLQQFKWNTTRDLPWVTSGPWSTSGRCRRWPGCSCGVWRVRQIQPFRSWLSLHSAWLRLLTLKPTFVCRPRMSERQSMVVGWVLLHVHRNRRLFRDGSPGRPRRLSHGSWALTEQVSARIKHTHKTTQYGHACWGWGFSINSVCLKDRACFSTCQAYAQTHTVWPHMLKLGFVSQQRMSERQSVF